ARLLAPPASEAARRRSALAVAVLDEPRARPGLDHALVLVDPRAVPAQAHDHQPDPPRADQRLTQRARPDDLVVLARLLEGEGRHDEESLVRGLEAHLVGGRAAAAGNA